MQVIGPFRLNAAQGAQSASRINSPSTGAANVGTGAEKSRVSASPVDQLDISAAGRAAASSGTSAPATVGGDMRLDKIADLRRQIASGTYDTPERFEAAFGKLLDDLG